MTRTHLIAWVLAWTVAAPWAAAAELRFALDEDARDELAFTSRAPLATHHRQGVEDTRLRHDT